MLVYKHFTKRINILIKETYKQMIVMEFLVCIADIT